MLESINKIYFKTSDFDSLKDMFEALFIQELSLIKNGYMCTVYKSLTNNNVYVLEFASLDPLFNQERLLPCWITSDEAGLIAQMRKEYYKNNFCDIINDALKLDANNVTKDDDDKEEIEPDEDFKFDA